MASWLKRLFAGPEKPAPRIPSPELGDLFVCIDFETTGLDPLKSRVIEVGAIRVNPSNKVHKTFQTLVDPGVDLPRKITQITGITTEQIRAEGSPSEQVFRDLRQFIGDLPLIAYNAAFDAKFLSAEWSRIGIRATNEYHDILEMARTTVSLRSYKLANVAKHLGVDVTADHRALSDAHAALLVYDKLMRLRG